MARKRRKRNFERDRGSEPKRRWHDDLAPETKQSVFAVVFFALAVIAVLAYWGRAGSLGVYLFGALTLAVGRAYFLIPITSALIGFSLLLAVKPRRPPTALIGGGLFLVSALAVVDLFFAERAGGWIGYLANRPLVKIFDRWATGIIELALLVVSVLIMGNVSLWRPRKPAEEAGVKPESLPEVPSTPLPASTEAKNANTPGRAGSSVMVETVEAKAGADEDFGIRAGRKSRRSYRLPPLSLLQDDSGTPSSGDIRANANIIKRTLLNFGVDVEMGEVSVGPTLTQYTLKPAEGVKLARIVALQNDLALALAAHPIRIEAPIPGKSLVGIEVPNRSIAMVGLRNLLENDIFQSTPAPLLFALGRDVAGSPVYANLSKMPHLLVAGATGSGKTVCLHSLITSFLYRNRPEMLKFLVVDPKRVELAAYAGIPHLLAPPITDPKKTIQALRWAVKEMERRYEVFSQTGTRDIAGYNERVLKKAPAEEGEEVMPYIVVVIDELADLMVSFPREVEGSIIRLAQMARAVGIHLVVATQRPSVEVITGLIKANITSRIAFQVSSQVDSRTILDAAGAEKLLGNGDMLFLAGDTAKPRRIQGGFVSEGEVAKIVEFIRGEGDAVPTEPATGDIFGTAASHLAGAASHDELEDEEDPLYEEARETVIKAGKASASYLQRRLKIGYARAARLLDILEERGVIGPGEGAKPREVIAKPESDGSLSQTP